MLLSKRFPALLAAFLVTPAFAADVDAGKSLYTTCIACHGAEAEGNRQLNSPALAGQSSAYLTRQLDLFKRGVRGAADGDVEGAQMRPMVMTLADDAAIENVVAYIATLPVARPETTIDGDAGNGLKQYNGACGACHGGSGEGNDALNSPRLTNIQDDYLLRQVEKFKSGQRGDHPEDKFGKQMKMMSGVLNDEQLRDVIAYLNGLAE